MPDLPEKIKISPGVQEHFLTGVKPTESFRLKPDTTVLWWTVLLTFMCQEDRPVECAVTDKTLDELTSCVGAVIRITVTPDGKVGFEQLSMPPSPFGRMGSDGEDDGMEFA